MLFGSELGRSNCAPSWPFCASIASGWPAAMAGRRGLPPPERRENEMAPSTQHRERRAKTNRRQRLGQAHVQHDQRARISPRGGPAPPSAWAVARLTPTTSTTPRRAGRRRAASWPTSRRVRRLGPPTQAELARRRRASRTAFVLQIRCRPGLSRRRHRRGAQGGAVPPQLEHRRGAAGGHCRRGRVLRGDDVAQSRGRPREHTGKRPRHGVRRHVNTRARTLPALAQWLWNVDRWCHPRLEQPRVQWRIGRRPRSAFTVFRLTGDVVGSSTARRSSRAPS